MNTPFNKRLLMLQNLANRPNSGNKRTINAAIHRNRCYTHQNPLKTLDLLRQIVQNSINKELDSIVQHYMQKFFAPAILNIRRNGFDVTDEQIHLICRKMLEEAKKMYCVSVAHDQENTLFETADDDRSNFPRLIKHVAGMKGKGKDNAESDTESEVSQASSSTSSVQKKKSRRETIALNSRKKALNVTSPKDMEILAKNIDKWNPARLTKETLFVLGSKANSALGLGAQRGRIYAKHPDIFRYNADLSDIQCLFDNNQKIARFRRSAFFLVLDDVIELSKTAEYRNNSSFVLDALLSFNVSDDLLNKIKAQTRVTYENICKRNKVENNDEEIMDINRDLTYASENISDQE